MPVGRRDRRVRRHLEGRLQRVEHVQVGAAHVRAPLRRPLLRPGDRLPEELLGEAVRPRRRGKSHPVLLDERRGHISVRQHQNGQGLGVEGKAEINRGYSSYPEGVTVPQFTDPTPVPLEKELLFWCNCTILKTCKMIWSAVPFVLHHFRTKLVTMKRKMFPRNEFFTTFPNILKKREASLEDNREFGLLNVLL